MPSNMVVFKISFNIQFPVGGEIFLKKNEPIKKNPINIRSALFKTGLQQTLS